MLVMLNRRVVVNRESLVLETTHLDILNFSNTFHLYEIIGSP